MRIPEGSAYWTAEERLEYLIKHSDKLVRLYDNYQPGMELPALLEPPYDLSYRTRLEWENTSYQLWLTATYYGCLDDVPLRHVQVCNRYTILRALELIVSGTPGTTWEHATNQSDQRSIRTARKAHKIVSAGVLKYKDLRLKFLDSHDLNSSDGDYTIWL